MREEEEEDDKGSSGSVVTQEANRLKTDQVRPRGSKVRSIPVFVVRVYLLVNKHARHSQNA